MPKKKKQLYVQKVAPGSLFLLHSTPIQPPMFCGSTHSRQPNWFYCSMYTVGGQRESTKVKGLFFSPLSVRSKQRRKLFTCVCLNRGKANYGQEKQSVHVCFRGIQKNCSLSCVQTVVVWCLTSNVHTGRCCLLFASIWYQFLVSVCH